MCIRDRVSTQSTWASMSNKHNMSRSRKMSNCYSQINSSVSGFPPLITYHNTQYQKSHVLCVDTVSYTHLTLPTICSVQISVVAASLKKKNTTTQDKVRAQCYKRQLVQQLS
eukprot:TRINITY_DN16458_c0_g1_i1.p3 TRINITY_DN16458_c0_g1~~TRINITY_DN16458_c0_g1_i1.p3  ORF type:complete len:112 (+),score=16.58 TRINITY_DN16458_c0_g1_i1:177-512(+)